MSSRHGSPVPPWRNHGCVRLGHHREGRGGVGVIEAVPGRAVLGPQPVEVLRGEQPAVGGLPRADMHISNFGRVPRSGGAHGLHLFHSLMTGVTL
jgi:hypothetical protein